MLGGWMWRIPVYVWGNGYIFDNNYINAGSAKEVEEYLDTK